MIVTREELEESLAVLVQNVRDPRAGILGPDSIAWRVGGDLAIFLGGGRAALLQLAHPMVAYAIDHHSKTRADVLGRFQRTFRHIFAMVFGELDDALAAARRVHLVHTRIHGVIPTTIGAWRAGTHYHANDAEALRWVHATLVDTTVLVRARLGTPISRGELDRYTIEMNRFAALFGIPRALLPATWADHEAYMASMLASDAIAVAPVAREMASFLIGREGAGAQPPLGRLTEMLAAQMLPAHLNEQFGLTASPRAVRAGFATLAPIYKRLPARLVAIPAQIDAARRLAGRPPSRLAAWTERQLFGLSGRVTGKARKLRAP
ncbi:MAG TPA: oxygenase MpaB family protein [Kofleriaceae bacterium]|nr:oxygenase MpaB family protein [Kofleriaceae bacterium]